MHNGWVDVLREILTQGAAGFLLNTDFSVAEARVSDPSLLGGRVPAVGDDFEPTAAALLDPQDVDRLRATAAGMAGGQPLRIVVALDGDRGVEPASSFSVRKSCSAPPVP